MEQLERLMFEVTEKGFRLTWLTVKDGVTDTVQIDSGGSETLQAFRDRFIKAVQWRYGDDVAVTVKAHITGLAHGLDAPKPDLCRIAVCGTCIDGDGMPLLDIGAMCNLCSGTRHHVLGCNKEHKYVLSP